MVRVIDQVLMRYLNLFGKISRVDVKDCFIFNNKIVFAVPRNKLSLAVGENGRNVRKASDLLPRKVKVIALPRDESEAKWFLLSITHPTEFKNLEITGDEMIITTTGMKNKAELMGRNKARMKELQSVVKQYFNKGLRII
ncbi:hypothetical protein COU61_04195 [Candidatus Pacearchaeota archaeon CG10_big_fil_rev_8_21_14_0_10_35_13]|nr:MAG: hypothetical protein COU61_04195 [Candidatus Pacearchaeota archaeon CG10_big_fil_rev_8_21_14_0_10_35_13]